MLSLWEQIRYGGRYWSCNGGGNQAVLTNSVCFPRPDRAMDQNSTTRGAVPEAGPGLGDRIPVLDGLRGVAMVMVFFVHAIADPLYSSTTPFDATVYAVVRTGWTSIDLFFVLSGFLITGILLDTKGEPRWWPNFLARRALRILPLYYGALTVLLVLVPRLVGDSLPGFATLQANQRWYWTYTTNVLYAVTRGHGTPLFTSHFWSLSIEEQYYLVWPLVVWACTPRALLRVAALAMIGGFAFRLGVVLHDPGNAVATYVLTPGRLDSLMTGAALAVAARMPGGLARWKDFAPRILGAGVLALSALAVWRGGLNLWDRVVAVVAYPAVALVCGAVLVVALTAPPTSRFVRMLSTVPLRNWGTYSYGIFVVHLPLLGAIEWNTTFSQRGVALFGGSRLPSVLLLAAVAMPVSYTLGALSYHLYEKRFLALKRYFVRSQRADAPCATPRLAHHDHEPQLATTSSRLTSLSSPSAVTGARPRRAVAAPALADPEGGPIGAAS